MSSSSFRSSQRLTITVPHSTMEALITRSTNEGRSISNLAAYLLESSLEGFLRDQQTIETRTHPWIKR